MSLGQRTIHHSVAIMDLFFSSTLNFNVNNQMIEICMLTALFISAKYYEKDSRGPTATDI